MFIEPSEPEELIIESESVTHNSLILSWKPPNPSHGFITQYRVEYKATGEDYQKLVTLPGKILAYEVTGLTANTEYHFRIAAVNSAGCGPFKNAIDSQYTSKLISMIRICIVNIIFVVRIIITYVP